MLALHNYIDRSALTVTASPSALVGLPTSNLKVPWFDGIARGSSAGRTVSLSWELATSMTDPENRVDLVALLGVNWRSTFSATLKWWNSGGSWSSPLGSTNQVHYYSGSYAPWIGNVPRNVFVPLPASASAQYWRLDVTLGFDLDGAAWPWEARRLWCGPALRFSMRKGARTGWGGTHAVADGETGIPNVSSGRTFRKVAFAGRALPFEDVYGQDEVLHNLNQLLFDKGPFAEAILLPRHVASETQPNHVQTMGLYGRLVPGLETIQGMGNRIDLAGELQEVPHPLPSPLAAPT